MVPFYSLEYHNVKHDMIRAARRHGKEIVDKQGKRFLRTEWGDIMRTVAGGSLPKSLFERRRVSDKIKEVAKKEGWQVLQEICSGSPGEIFVYVPCEAQPDAFF